MKKFDLTWGESVAVRQAFVETAKTYLISVKSDDLYRMGYTRHEGDEDLIELTRQVIKRQTGMTCKHILLTNGATGGVTIALRTYFQQGYNAVFTRSPPYFSVYPMMIKAAGYDRHVREAEIILPGDKPVSLIDSPTNPEGIALAGITTLAGPIVWDAVYHSRVYGRLLFPLPFDVIVGSYSKLTGVNGIRVGWIATNDDLFYERAKMLVTAEYCGLSELPVSILKSIQKEFDWKEFETTARKYLDYNREEWAKLAKYFDGKEPSRNGMFYYALMDKACKKLMEKAGVEWMCSSKLGVDHDEAGRFNIGQDNKLVKAAVQAVLKADRRK